MIKDTPQQNQLHFDNYVNVRAGGTVNISKTIQQYREAPKTESKTEGSQVKVTATQKRALQSICEELGIGVSTFIGKAIETQLRILPFEEKLTRYEDAVIALLNSLP